MYRTISVSDEIIENFYLNDLADEMMRCCLCAFSVKIQ